MESRVFITRASAVIRKIDDSNLLSNLSMNGNNVRDEIQKEVNQLFGGLQNPTLPSAYKLRDAAMDAGYNIDQKVLGQLSKFEYL